MFTSKILQLKHQNGFNTIWTYFTHSRPTFCTNIDVHSLRMTHKGPKHVGVLVL